MSPHLPLTKEYHVYVYSDVPGTATHPLGRVMAESEEEAIEIIQQAEKFFLEELEKEEGELHFYVSSGMIA